MFGRRSNTDPAPPVAPPPAGPAPVLAAPNGAAPAARKSGEELLRNATEASLKAPVAMPKADDDLSAAKDRIYSLLMEQIDIATSSRLPRDELKRQIIEIIGEIVVEQKLPLSQSEQQLLANQIVDDMLGFGPLEPLLRDDLVTDIMVNGPYQIYVERKGKLELTDVKFRDNAHVMTVATRIVTGVGRRVDESSPICDARLPDGSRVNVIAQPCAIRGAAISIRKFSQKKITLDTMASQKNISDSLCKVLKIFGAVRLNIIISGGTGSGKTTLLNAISRMISHGERIVTIEDAAELQLQQPHVVPLETRIANLEGEGEITMRDLVKNALRMRPDRIILGEVRGAEAFDLLQAMNTGHDGSMGTLHANTPREALTRLENMIGMAGINLPSKAVRTQISNAVNVIVQISRMRDGIRRITHLTEVVGMEGDVVITQDLFTFEFKGEDENGKLTGEFKSTGIRPHFTHQAAYYGLDQALIEAMMAGQS
ncbi:MAG: CpaF family protein [Pseudomonadota bacterium]|nr:CpaF family protein [Pseudomonadota bacterium]MDE3037056.1 CpaF family protein [Pseudomonadota bacterium]